MALLNPDTRQVQPLLLLSGAMLLTIALVATAVARLAAGLSPHVGAIVTFDPTAPSGFASNARLTAARLGRGDCELNLGLMRMTGGSLVLERWDPLPAGLFVVHWAGPHTSVGAKDCGTDTELRLTIADLVAVAAAAGGFGVGRRGPGSSSARGRSRSRDASVPSPPGQTKPRAAASRLETGSVQSPGSV